MAQSPISSITKLANNIDLSSDTLVQDLRARIPFFPIENLPSKHRAGFETKGTELWNLATRFHRDNDAQDKGNADRSAKVALLRVFAFSMLNDAATSRMRKVKQEATCSRILKVAFKTIKACVDADELEFAGKVASRVAGWLDKGQDIIPEDEQKKLWGEYFVWRMALVCSLDAMVRFEGTDMPYQGMEAGQARCCRAYVGEVPINVQRPT